MDIEDPGREQYALAIRLLHQYQTDWVPNTLDKAIEAGQLAVQITAENHPDYGARHSDLAAIYLNRYDLNGNFDDLLEATRVGSIAVSSTTRDDPLRPAFLNNLANCLYSQYQNKGVADGLDGAIQFLGEAVGCAPPEDGNVPKYINTMVNVLVSRSELKGSGPEALKDAQDAVDLGQNLMDTTWIAEDDPDRPIFCNTFANSLMGLYEQMGGIENLDRAIEVRKAAIDSLMEEDPSWLKTLHSLGVSFERRYDVKGVEEDLLRAIEIAQRVMRISPDEDFNFPTYLNALGVKIASLYDSTGELSYLREAIQLFRWAIDRAPEDYPERADWWNNLGTELASLFRITGELQDINNSIEAIERAVNTTPKDHFDYTAYLTNLSTSFETRFGWTGNMIDLDNAIMNAESAMNMTADSDRRLPNYVKAVGTKFSHRYEITGELTDLEQAVRLAQLAVDMTPMDYRNRASFLNDLGHVLVSRYQRFGDINDLNKAIQHTRDAVNLTKPSHYDFPVWLNSLSSKLSHRYNHTGEGTDLDEAIQRGRESVESAKEDHLGSLPKINNLATVLCTKYKSTMNLQYLEESIELMEEVLHSTSEENFNWPTYLFNQGLKLVDRYEHKRNPEDLDKALECFISSSQALQAAPLHRVAAGRAAIRILITTGNLERARELASEALNLLPVVCSRYMGLEDQQHAIAQTAGLAADACSLSLKIGEVERALQQLELGRGMIVGYMVDSQSDLSQLRKVNLALTERYEELRYKVSRKIVVQDTEIRDRMLKDRREAIRLMNDCIDEIRQYPTQERFLLELTVQELKEAASFGPIVAVNVTDIGADALIITSETIKAIRLPGLSTRNAPLFVQHGLRQYESFARTNSSRDIGSETDCYSRADQLSWLWSECVRLVLDDLGMLGLCASESSDADDIPRVWWIGSGIASSFPFHAAIVGCENSVNNTLSYIIPSYTPCIKVLAHSRAQIHGQARPKNTNSVLIVTMPTTPGERSLPGVKLEESIIEKVCMQSFSIKRLPNPTAAEVLKELTTSTIFHCACHGISDPTDPSKSHLLLQKITETGLVVDRLTLSQISNVVADGAQIAFLSACSTAEVKAGRLAEEGLHLASAFQVVGFAHVIGALWTADDDICVRLAEIFYTRLTTTNQSTISDKLVASALREAVCQVRQEYPDRPELWAPFVHFGP